MKRIVLLILIVGITSTIAILLYTHFVITLLILAVTILLTTVTLIIWAYNKSEPGQMFDAIRERYKMNTISSNIHGRYTSVEEASKKCPEDIDTIKSLLRSGNSGFQKIKFLDSLPEWIIRQAVPFLAISTPKWVIAIAIGILVLRFHDGIVAHRTEEKIQQKSNIIALQLQTFGVIQSKTGELYPTININNLCAKESAESNVILAYELKCD